MSRGTASALTMIRVQRGAPRPSLDELRQALARDRAALNIEEVDVICDFGVAGPYAIRVDGKELDEYVVWER
ncbi:MAG: hypothetical protein HY270_08860 [Deltaproteobacteria bacterium]|nr:hypothetical protein [Deltaproteobacteria bacterium]